MQIYGTSRSRSLRVLWLAQELGLAFEHIPLDWQQCGQDAAYLALNPAGTIPALVDGDFVLAESMAINAYLARRDGRLWPPGEQDEARFWQWTLWASSSLEAPYLQWASQALWLPQARRDAGQLAQACQALQRPLARLNVALQDRDYLLGSAFSVADLNVAGVINGLRRFDFTHYPAVADWLQRCLARPAYLAAARLP